MFKHQIMNHSLTNRIYDSKYRFCQDRALNFFAKLFANKKVDCEAECFNFTT